MPKNNKNNPQLNINLSDETKPFAQRIDEVRSLVEENLHYTKAIRQTSSTSELAGQRELKKLLQENLEISKELYEMTKKIKSWLNWQRILGVVKILLIVIPIILGIIYLPPLISKVLEPYQELLNLDKNFNPSDLLKQSTNISGNEQTDFWLNWYLNVFD